jgi:glutathionyl-hydroquinone reductase
MNEKIEKIFYTINELSQLISISAAGIRSKIYRKQIPSYKILGRVMIPVQWVKQVIKKACNDAQDISELLNKEN